MASSVLIGGFQIGQAAPYAEALATARLPWLATVMVLTFTGPGRLEARGLQPLPDLGAGISLDSIVLPWDGQL